MLPNSLLFSFGALLLILSLATVTIVIDRIYDGKHRQERDD